MGTVDNEGVTEKEIKIRYTKLVDHLDEKGRRLWCANEALAFGKRGISAVSRATKVSRTTITEGVRELNGDKEIVSSGRTRRQGGGRRKNTEKDKSLRQELEKIVEPTTVGDPERPLKWTSKSLRNLAKELNKDQHRASHSLVGRVLQDMGYSLQVNKKTKEGGDNPDRDEQFHFINAKVEGFLAEGEPVISVDCKKKENLGNYKNNGEEYAPKGQPTEVKVYDFPNKKLGKAVPYGVYEIDRNKGWVNVGVSSDTGRFAVESIRRWWHRMGRSVRPHAKKLYINADGGGSNGSRNKLWKVELQKFATESGLEIHVSHFPPGTSKWNKIEHRMFCFISKNWRGKPLLDRASVVNFISNTTTEKGLEIKACLDENVYEKGIEISDDELASISIEFNDFCGKWNYVIFPQN